MVAGDGGLVDVEHHLPVVGASLEHLRAERHEVVERGQHLYKYHISVTCPTATQARPLTIEEINSIRLEELVRELEHRPHVGRDAAELVLERVHEIVHVVEQVEQLVLEREHHNGDDDLLDLRKDLGGRVDGVHDRADRLRDTHGGERLFLVRVALHDGVEVDALGLVSGLTLLRKSRVSLAL